MSVVESFEPLLLPCQVVGQPIVHTQCRLLGVLDCNGCVLPKGGISPLFSLFSDFYILCTSLLQCSWNLRGGCMVFCLETGTHFSLILSICIIYASISLAFTIVHWEREIAPINTENSTCLISLEIFKKLALRLHSGKCYLVVSVYV